MIGRNVQLAGRNYKCLGSNGRVESSSSVEGIGLSEAIAAIRRDLLAARTAAVGTDLVLPVESVTVELQVVAVRSAEGKAGFTVPFVNVELGGGVGWHRETTQKITVVLGSARHEDGQEPFSVSESTNELLG